MLDSKYRYVIDKPMNFLAKGFIRIGITPNMITITAFLLGLLAGSFIGYGRFILAVVFLWLSGLLDVLDGQVARLSNQTSPFGAYLDMIFDRLVESAIVIGFLYHFPEHSVVYALFLVSIIFNFSSFMLAGSLFKNSGIKSIHYDIGLAERTETFIFFTLMMVFTEINQYILLCFIVIVAITGVLRMIRIKKFLQKH